MVSDVFYQHCYGSLLRKGRNDDENEIDSDRQIIKIDGSFKGNKKLSKMDFGFDGVSVASSSTATYEIIGTIGQGSFGIVMKGRKLETNEMVALKRIPIKKDRNNEHQIVREMVVLRNTHHENVVKLLDVLHDSTSVSFVLELAESNLKAVIDNSCYTLFENTIRGYFYQILRGVSYLHSLSIMHRDLKPGNILIFPEGVLKITDFGQSCFYSHHDSSKSYENQVASRWYRAPELLFGSVHYSPKVDLWSCGCILAELYNRASLFPGKNNFEQISYIMRVLGSPCEENWKGWNNLPDSNKLIFEKMESVKDWGKIVPQASFEALVLLRNLLVYDPEIRISASEALSSSFFSGSNLSNPSYLSTDCISFQFFPTVMEYNDNNAFKRDFIYF